MKRLLSFIFAISTLFVGYTQPALQQFINNPALKHASIGVSVKDLTTGENIVSFNEDKSLTTASIMKLFTTATALELLGPDYRYETTLALDANNRSRLLLIGSGDPTLGSSALNNNNPSSFLADWSKKLQTRLAGTNKLNLYVVDNLFGYDGVSDEWTWIDMGNYYAAGAYGVSVFDNTYRLFFNTTSSNSAPKIVRTDPQIKDITFINYLTLNSTGRDNGYIYGVPFSYERILRGNIPAGRTAFSIKGDIPDPGLMLGEVLATKLSNKGIRITSIETARDHYISSISSGTRKGFNYKVGEVLHVHQSPPLTDIVREVNVESNNHYAEHLIRTIGRNENSDIYSNALKEGLEYVNNHWKESGISTSSLFMHDGCGLAPQNAASPALFTNLLVYMHNNSRYAKEFFASLPLAGRDGTLKYFMNGTKYSRKVRAKSGSIGGVQCYAGYLIDGNKRYAFTIMVNKFTGSRRSVRKSIERFIGSL